LDEGWADWKEEPIRSQMVNGDNVEVERRRQVIIKTRRTVHGFERQRVERVVETWNWDDVGDAGANAESPNGAADRETVAA
jgi:F-box/leucine-rich repeat protein 10/11